MRKYTKIKYICMATIATAISLLVSGNCLEGDQNLPGGLSIVYAQENGSVTRKEVEDLISAGTTKAFRLLKELCEDGKLEQKGSGKLSTYVAK